MDVYIVYVPNTTWMRPYSTERRALAGQAEAQREGMVAHILLTKMNKAEEPDSEPQNESGTEST